MPQPRRSATCGRSARPRHAGRVLRRVPHALCQQCAEAFRAVNPEVRCYVVEPAGAAVLAGREATHPNHRIQGGGYANRSLPFLKGLQVDGYLQISDGKIYGKQVADRALDHYFSEGNLTALREMALLQFRAPVSYEDHQGTLG